MIEWLESLGRKRVIECENGDYLVRYYILFKRSLDKVAEANKFNLFLHNFKASDIPYPHDHPWPWFSLILKGGYWEHVPVRDASGVFTGETTKNWRGPGSICFRKAKDFHWVELEPGVDTWTLFGHGNREQDWGFLIDGKWVSEKDFHRSQ